MEKACRVPATGQHQPSRDTASTQSQTPPQRTGASSLSTGTVSQLSSPQKGPRSAAPDRVRQGANELPPSCIQWPLPASPPASQQRHDPSSSSVSSGQLCGASGAGAFSPLPPVVRAPSEGMSAVSPPGGSPPRDMTSFTLGTMSPPPARSATACAMGLDLSLATAWYALLTTMHPLRTHLRDGLELEAARRHVAPVACLARAHIGLDDSPPRLRRAAAQLVLHLKARRLQGGRLSYSVAA